MNIIERTQYSADGGETWALSEENARICAVHGSLAEWVGEMRAGYILDSIREHPEAIIAALRDMGALPADDGWAAQRGYRDALEYAVDNGSFCLHDVAYAVVPTEQHEKQEAALWKIKDWARYGSVHSASKAARDWCNKHDINVNEFK